MALESLWLEQEAFPEVSGQPRVVRALLLMMAASHRPTYLHLCQVAFYTEMLAQRCGFSRSETKLAHSAALLHDIGKVAVADQILSKPARLTDHEALIMTRHAVWGADIIERTGGQREIVDAVHHHHEWYDGMGYPDGIAGSEIPIVSRMIAIADAFDTMTTPRPYRQAVSVDAALRELERCSKHQFDPDLTGEFVKMIREAVAHGRGWVRRRLLRAGWQRSEAEPLALRLSR